MSGVGVYGRYVQNSGVQDGQRVLREKTATERPSEFLIPNHLRYRLFVVFRSLVESISWRAEKNSYR
ncbi:MAG: hypothetical protein ACJAZF_000550 [Granulosicoccus sp.]|jgi:hypothetical protein